MSSQGELATTSGSTVPSATETSAVGDDLEQLEKEVEAEVAAMMESEPAATVPTPETIGIPDPVASPALTSGKPSPVHPAEVIGNLASGLDGGDEPMLTLQEINDPIVEAQVRKNLGQFTEAQFARALKDAKYHPEYKNYVKAVHLELGEDCDEWSFGDEEPEEDLVGLHCYAVCKAKLRERLGLKAPSVTLDHPSLGAVAKETVHPAALQQPVPKTGGVTHPASVAAAPNAPEIAQPVAAKAPERLLSHQQWQPRRQRLLNHQQLQQPPRQCKAFSHQLRLSHRKLDLHS